MANEHAAACRRPPRSLPYPLLCRGGRVQHILFAQQERLSIVDESSSGKSQTGRAIMGLMPQPAEISAKRLEFNGTNLLKASAAERRTLRDSCTAMILQDQKYFLDPAMTIGRQIIEMLRTHERFGKPAARWRALYMLSTVHTRDPKRVYDLYPHEISDGIG